MAPVKRWRRLAASFFAIAALSLLLFAVLMVAVCLYHATRDGRLADLWAPASGGNHGPWRHYAPARMYLDPSIVFVPPAVILAFISLALHARRLPVFILIGCATFFVDYLLFFSAALD